VKTRGICNICFACSSFVTFGNIDV